MHEPLSVKLKSGSRDRYNALVLETFLFPLPKIIFRLKQFSL
jgi:hypothetical protein